MATNANFYHQGRVYNFNDIARDFKSVKRKLPVIWKATAVNFFKKRFDEQNWVGNRTKPWKKRKSTAKRNKGRKILVDTGLLRNSIRGTRTSFEHTEIGTSTPYAAAHNEGFRGTVTVKAHSRNRKGVSKGRTGSCRVKSHTRRMNLPQRQFMGHSAYMERQLTRITKARINPIFK